MNYYNDYFQKTAAVNSLVLDTMLYNTYMQKLANYTNLVKRANAGDIVAQFLKEAAFGEFNEIANLVKQNAGRASKAKELEKSFSILHPFTSLKNRGIAKKIRNVGMPRAEKKINSINSGLKRQNATNANNYLNSLSTSELARHNKILRSRGLSSELPQSWEYSKNFVGPSKPSNIPISEPTLVGPPKSLAAAQATNKVNNVKSFIAPESTVQATPFKNVGNTAPMAPIQMPMNYMGQSSPMLSPVTFNPNWGTNAVRAPWYQTPAFNYGATAMGGLGIGALAASAATPRYQGR